jgi:hypothetical protein
MKLELDIPDEIAESIQNTAMRLSITEGNAVHYYVLESGRRKARLRAAFWRSLAAQCE